MLGGFIRQSNLEEDLERAPLFAGDAVEGLNQLRGVYRVNHVCDLRDASRLISLKMANEVPARLNVCRAECSCFGFERVNPVLTEVRLTKLGEGERSLRLYVFRDRDDADISREPPRVAGGICDPSSELLLVVF